jgi:hypothetical protein
MRGKRILGRALLFSIVVLVVGFLGFAVRAFSTPDLTRLVFAGLVVASIGILVWYFMRHRPVRELTAQSAFHGPAVAKTSMLPHLLAWKLRVVEWMRIGRSFLSRKIQSEPGERVTAEDCAAPVPKLPDSRRAA